MLKTIDFGGKPREGFHAQDSCCSYFAQLGPVGGTVLEDELRNPRGSDRYSLSQQESTADHDPWALGGLTARAKRP